MKAIRNQSIFESKVAVELFREVCPAATRQDRVFLAQRVRGFCDRRRDNTRNWMGILGMFIDQY